MVCQVSGVISSDDEAMASSLDHLQQSHGAHRGARDAGGPSTSAPFLDSDDEEMDEGEEEEGQGYHGLEPDDEDNGEENDGDGGDAISEDEDEEIDPAVAARRASFGRRGSHIRQQRSQPRSLSARVEPSPCNASTPCEQGPEWALSAHSNGLFGTANVSCAVLMCQGGRHVAVPRRQSCLMLEQLPAWQSHRSRADTRPHGLTADDLSDHPKSGIRVRVAGRQADGVNPGTHPGNPECLLCAETQKLLWPSRLISPVGPLGQS